MKTAVAQIKHVHEIMAWFPDKESVIRWGSIIALNTLPLRNCAHNSGSWARGFLH